MDGFVLVVLLVVGFFAWIFGVDREARRRVAQLEHLTRDLSSGLYHAHLRIHHVEQWLHQASRPAPAGAPIAEPAIEPSAQRAIEPTAVPAIEPSAQRAIEPTAVPAIEPDVASAAAPRSSVEAPPPPRVPDVPLPPHTPEHEPPPEPVDLERWLGVRGAAALGAVVLVVALFYFLRFSVERGWLTPTLRVVFGYVVSFAALAASDLKLRRVHPTMGAWIAGASFGGLFASTWAAHRVVGLVDAPAAFGLFVVCAVATLAYATHRDSAPVALLGLLGGLAAPLAFHTAGEALSATPLSPLVLAYVFLLDVAVIGLSVRRGWWSCALLSLATTAGYVGWFLLDEERPLLAQAIPSLLVAAIFGALPEWMWRRTQSGHVVAAEDDSAAQLLRFGAVTVSGVVGVWLAAGGTVAHALVGLTSLLSTLGIAVVLQRRAARGSAELAALFVVVGAAAGLGRALVDGAPTTAPMALSVAAIAAARVLLMRFVKGAGSAAPLDFAALALFIVLSLEPTLATFSFVAFGVLVLVRFHERAQEVEAAGTAEAPAAPGELAGLIGALLFFTRWTLDPSGVSTTRQLLPLGLGLLLFARAMLPLRAGLRGERPLRAVARTVAETVLLGAVALAAAPATTPIMLCVTLGLGLGLASSSGGASVARRVVAAAFAVGAATLFAELRAEHETSATLLSFAAISYLGVEAAWGARAVDEADLDGLLLTLLALLGIGVHWIAGRYALGPYVGLVLLAAAASVRALHARKEETIASSLLVVATAWLIARILSRELFETTYLVALALGALLFTLLYRWRPLRVFVSLSGVGLAWVAKLAGIAAVTQLGGAIVPLVVVTALAAHVWILLRDRARTPLVELVEGCASLLGLGGGLVLISALAVGLREGQSATESSLLLSLGWGLYGTAVLALGVKLVSPNLRWLGLGAILVTCAKVFLFDLADLRDLARVASLVGLAVSLLGVSGLYQRFVRGPSRPAVASPRA